MPFDTHKIKYLTLFTQIRNETWNLTFEKRFSSFKWIQCRWHLIREENVSLKYPKITLTKNSLRTNDLYFSERIFSNLDLDDKNCSSFIQENNDYYQFIMYQEEITKLPCPNKNWWTRPTEGYCSFIQILVFNILTSRHYGQ